MCPSFSQNVGIANRCADKAILQNAHGQKSIIHHYDHILRRWKSHPLSNAQRVTMLGCGNVIKCFSGAVIVFVCFIGNWHFEGFIIHDATFLLLNHFWLLMQLSKSIRSVEFIITCVVFVYTCFCGISPVTSDVIFNCSLLFFTYSIFIPRGNFEIRLYRHRTTRVEPPVIAFDILLYLIYVVEVKFMLEIFLKLAL